MNRIVPIEDVSRIAEARRLVTDYCHSEGLNEEAAGRAALIVSELGTNLLKYAQKGEIHLAGLSAWTSSGVEIVSLDCGPGISDLDQSLRDGYSTAGSSGTGLGAISRLSDEFDAWSEYGKGTVIFSRVRDRNGKLPEPRFELGVVCRPVHGEALSGDAWAVCETRSGALLLVADGLGHGAGASDASAGAIAAFRRSSAVDPVALIRDIHESLRGTRGAAVAVAAIDWEEATVRFAGIGNISGTIITNSRIQSMVSHSGTAGHEARRFQEFTYSLPEGSLIILHSDGIATHWNFESQPRLARRHPAIIAAALYREEARHRDDACVVVMRRARS